MKLYANYEIECSLIGRMLCTENKSAFADLDYSEADFAFPENWKFYNEILSGKTLADYLGTENHESLLSMVDFVGGMPLVPGDDNYRKILKELSTKRKLYAMVKEMDALLPSRDSTELLLSLKRVVDDGIDPREIKTDAQVRADIETSLSLPKSCYPTGLGHVDEAMGGGLYEGFTYGFCGAEKAGKTTIAHTISYQLKCPHLYIAMEMGSTQIEQRNVARELGINSLEFLKRPEGLRGRLAAGSGNRFYYDAPGAMLDDILHQVGMTQLKHGIKGFILDYWQLVDGQQKGESEERHLRRVAQGVANFARKNKLWCILLAQMNKEGQLFGGNGLRKACDQLYMIQQCEQPKNGRWLDLNASRYTERKTVGSDTQPCLWLETSVGPYFKEV